MSNELGTLVVVVLKARNLNDKHTFHKQDVFAQISLNGTTKRTAVDIRGGQNPVWDEEIRITVTKDSSEKNRTLEVSCWEKEPKTEDLLGQGKVDIRETLRTGEFDDWVKLETNGGYRGEVFLEMTFYANAPAPLDRRPSKLDPKVRLAPPTQPYKYSNAASSPPRSPRRDLSPGPVSQTSPKGTHPVPPSSRSPSSPKGHNDALPPIPEGSSRLPAATNAGLKKQGPPSILRPGNPKSSPIPIGLSRPDPLDDGRQPQNQPEHYRPISAQTSGLPNPYEQAPGVSFPIAAVGDAHTPVYESQYNYRPSQEPAYLPPTMTLVDNDLPDPYLSARYLQPLPLPQGYSPPRQPPARRDPAAEAAEIRRQAVLLEEQKKAKQKEQEEADAELARRLDLELNSSDGQETERSDGVHMPGGW